MWEYGLDWGVPWSREKIRWGGDENIVMAYNKAVDLAKGVAHDVGRHALTIKIMIFTILGGINMFTAKNTKQNKTKKSKKR